MPESEDSTSLPDQEIVAIAAGLPGEIRDTVTGWIHRARAADPSEVESELVAEARAWRRSFQSAADDVARMIGG